MTYFTQNTIQTTFNRSAATYDSASLLAQEICQRLLEPLHYMRFQPKLILDLGAATGYANRFLKELYPGAEIVAVDLAEKLLCLNAGQNVCASAQNLPFSVQSFDLVFSNLMLPWCEDPTAVLADIYRVLKPGGLLLFSTFGPGTLQEIYHSWQAVDAYPHVHPCYDIQDMGDVLLQQQFTDPVMNSETLVINYRDIRQLCRELKQSGMQNIVNGRFQGLISRQRWQQFLQRLDNYRNPQGRLPISFEVLYGQAWRSELIKASSDEVIIPVSSIKRGYR